MSPVVAEAMAMLDVFNGQREWSYKTFGPPSFKGPKGPLDHLQKEAREAYEETDAEKLKEELADCLMLVFDAAHRHGMSYDELADAAMRKFQKNQLRKWPQWQGTDPDRRIEHDRSKEQP